MFLLDRWWSWGNCLGLLESLSENIRKRNLRFQNMTRLFNEQNIISLLGKNDNHLVSCLVLVIMFAIFTTGKF
jgi:hypothetical protein